MSAPIALGFPRRHLPVSAPTARAVYLVLGLKFHLGGGAACYFAILAAAQFFEPSAGERWLGLANARIPTRLITAKRSIRPGPSGSFWSGDQSLGDEGQSFGVGQCGWVPHQPRPIIGTWLARHLRVF